MNLANFSFMFNFSCPPPPHLTRVSGLGCMLLPFLFPLFSRYWPWPMPAPRYRLNLANSPTFTPVDHVMQNDMYHTEPCSRACWTHDAFKMTPSQMPGQTPPAYALNGLLPVRVWNRALHTAALSRSIGAVFAFKPNLCPSFPRESAVSWNTALCFYADVVRGSRGGQSSCSVLYSPPPHEIKMKAEPPRAVLLPVPRMLPVVSKTPRLPPRSPSSLSCREGMIQFYWVRARL